MDPVGMEGKGGEPVMFNRVLSVRALRTLRMSSCCACLCTAHCFCWAHPHREHGLPLMLIASLERLLECCCVGSFAHSSSPHALLPPVLAPQVVKASQPRLPPPVATAVGNRGATQPPAGPMDLDSPKSPAGRKRARKQPASPSAAQPLSPTSPTSPSAADAAAVALAQAAGRSGEASLSGRELVPLPDQLQEAVEAAMASGERVVADRGRVLLQCCDKCSLGANLCADVAELATVSLPGVWTDHPSPAQISLPPCRPAVRRLGLLQREV